MQYKSDISPSEAWEKLKKNSDCLLIDVRTQAEWFFTGVVDLSPLKKECIFLEWQIFPDMHFNSSFIQTLEKILKKQHPQEILFLCRSGQRSAEAANCMANRGYRECYNIRDGFEGAANAYHHRSSMGGWRHAGLPWIQL